DHDERHHACDGQEFSIAARQPVRHPSFLRCVVTSANESASASLAPYHTRSKIRVSASSAGRAPLDDGSRRTYSRGVRVRSTDQAPFASRNDTAHQYEK